MTYISLKENITVILVDIRRHPFRTSAILVIMILASIGLLFLGSYISSMFNPPLATSTTTLTNEVIIQTGPSSTAVQNVNQEAKYLWANEKTWKVEETGAGYLVRLVFIANGPVIPVSPCLYIQTNANLAGVGAVGYSSMWATGTSTTGAYVRCFLGLSSTVNFEVFFSSAPIQLQAALVQDERGLNATVAPASFKIPVIN